MVSEHSPFPVMVHLAIQEMAAAEDEIDVIDLGFPNESKCPSWRESLEAVRQQEQSRVISMAALGAY
jgi:hypothetical protein